MNAKIRLGTLSLVLSTILLAAFSVLDGAAALPLRPANPILEPDPNDHQVPRNSIVAITYDEDINPNTVNETTFAVFGMESGLFFDTYSIAGGKIQLTPEQAFHAGELVQVTATTETLSIVDGLGPLQPTVWQFRARSEGGSAFFKDTGQALGEMNSLSVGLGDLDGDGDLDAFVASCGPSFVWINTGGMVFADSGQRLGSDICSVDVALGDLDSDGDLDAFTASSGTSYFGKVWWNNGAAVFTDSSQNIGDSLGSGVALGDLDGDGDLDAIYVRKGPAKVLLNDGNGIFTDSGQDLVDQVSMDVALGDLDGDNDLDVYIANTQNTEGRLPVDKVYLNDGHGFFSDTGQSLSESPNNTAALGDLDNDGDLDVYLAVTRPVGSQIGPDEVWLNDGSGNFTDSGQRIGIASSNQANLADLDGDGDLDVFVANLYMTSEVWLNDGSGSFSLTREYLGLFSKPFLELGDMDGDGDVDAFLTDYGKPGSAWFNQNYTYWNFAPKIAK
ncbi:MAG: hypothetical protein A2Z49_11310 [Chloroflexi bacterium RBG_19FT_COMBO_56_12]|nr:MAG: hypothetical protein A2Z49_11310 [Chloroflexi bacterium RBG_19FT_COMBO_56_12]